MISSLILQLARGIWFIEPASANSYKPVVEAILSGKNVDFKSLMPKYAMSDDDRDVRESAQKFVLLNSSSIIEEFGNINEAPKGSVAVTYLQGVVMKHDFCGSAGTKTIESLMKEADANPNISAHILHVDSPGGSADATIDLGETIKSLNKPVLAFSDGLMASAAYWIASSAKHIMASNALNEIGSIGTYTRILDWSKAMEMDGVKEIVVYATKSTEKNGDYRSAIAGDLDPMRATIDKYNEQFLSTVKRNRFGKNLNEEQTLKGQLHLTDNALKFGLIDSVGNFEQSIKKVQSFIKA